MIKLRTSSGFKLEIRRPKARPRGPTHVHDTGHAACMDWLRRADGLQTCDDNDVACSKCPGKALFEARIGHDLDHAHLGGALPGTDGSKCETLNLGDKSTARSIHLVVCLVRIVRL
jgi:hypothetical protein